MQKTTRAYWRVIFPLTLGSVAFVLLMMLGVASPAVANGASAPDSVIKTTTIKTLYQDWSRRYLKAGGDRNVMIALGAVRGLSPATKAKGWMWLNLISGEVAIQVEGLPETSDVWLVDNQRGQGKSLLPEEGDHMVPLGRLELGSDVAKLETTLGPDFFKDFELDLVVVSQADVSPMESRILIGSRSTFERRHTRERLARQMGITASRKGPNSDLRSFADDPRVRLGLVGQDVLEGGELFFRGTFNGNGRSCGTCHPPENNLVIDPRFIKARRAEDRTDSLFVAERGHPNQVPNLEIPQFLRNFGLILENIDGFEDPLNKFVMRSVPHTLSMATSITPPEDDDADGVLPDGSTLDFLERTGWSGDGAPMPGTLRIFPVGAVIQHYTRNFFIREPGPESFRLQTDDELDKMEAFMLSTGRMNNLDLAGVELTDHQAESGRVLFTTGMGGAKCFACHFNAGANSAFSGNRNVNTGIETVRIQVLDNRGIPPDGGFGGQGLDTFNFDANDDGVFDSFGNGTFNIPPLVEAADTGPFFHTNALKTLEGAVRFYSGEAFANSPGGAIVETVFGEGINLSEEQTQDVAAFLRVINAAFNLSMAIQRIEAAREIENEFGLQEIALTNELLKLANEELGDARRVLKKKNLNPFARADIKRAIRYDDDAIASVDPLMRQEALNSALNLVIQAKDSLGTGLEFEMGEGNLVF